MPAQPNDVARYTSDGVLITLKNAAIKDQDPNAIDTGERELPMFFDDANHGQIVLQELFDFVSAIGRPHEAVETGDRLGLGSTVPVWPKAPQVDMVDVSRSVDTAAVIRAYGFDMGSDSYALELVGVRARAPGGTSVTFDKTTITFDNAVTRWDNGV